MEWNCFVNGKIILQTVQSTEYIPAKLGSDWISYMHDMLVVRGKATYRGNI